MDGWMDEKMRCMYTTECYSAIKKYNPTIWDNMDGPWEYYAKWNKSERQISYDFTYNPQTEKGKERGGGEGGGERKWREREQEREGGRDEREREIGWHDRRVWEVPVTHHLQAGGPGEWVVQSCLSPQAWEPGKIPWWKPQPGGRRDVPVQQQSKEGERSHFLCPSF